jgi:4-amino-4-deoxy-L-arabinose transferase-like glycosyltransferase
VKRGWAAVALLAAWMALGLFGHDPWKPDEAYSFGLVYRILEHGDWVVPSLAGLPFVEKPPLFYWTAALFCRLFGWALPPHDAARLASAFYVGLALWFTYLMARRNLAAPLLLAGCLGYLQHAHQLITDNALVAGVAVGLYGIVRGSGLWLGTGAGVAFLAKGLLGPGVLGLTALGVLAFRAWRASWRTWPWALIAFAPWAIIWPWLLHQRSPALFHEWFWVNNFGRFTGEAGLGGVLDHAHYAKALVWFGFPAWPLAAWALWRDRLRAPLAQLALVAFLVIFIVLSAASSARTLYALPLLIPLALLGAIGLETLPVWMAKPLNALAVEGAALLGLVLWAGWLAFLAGWRPPLLESLSPGYAAHAQPIALGAALALTAGWFYALRSGLPGRWLAGLTLVWGLAMTLWLGWLDHAKSYRGVIADMQRARPPAKCVTAPNLSEPQRAVFDYFAGIHAGDEHCPLLLLQSSSERAPVPGDGWRPLWHGTRPGDSKEFFWLYGR